MIDRLTALGQKPPSRYGFYIALTVILTLALLPQSGEQGFAHADKLMHFLLFLLIALAGRLTHQSVPVAYLALALLAYGGLMELMQGMTSWRMASAGDLLADAAGILAGLPLAGRLMRPSHKL
ncbi:VanZ family protein [Allohahella marinimesophila]|uniref:VanZ family protein n=1 Tax=Allohahella marinimesophila TaxID=1054972 RepID=A0ABP7PUU8_9GAMM